MDPYDAIQQLGLPIGIVICLLLGIWKCSQWLGQHLIMPVRDVAITVAHKHSRLVDTLEEKARTDSDTMREIKVAINEQCKCDEMQMQSLELQRDALKRIMEMEISEGESLESLHGKIDKLLQRATERRQVDG